MTFFSQLSCATCTILLSITSQLAQIYNETITESLQRYCTYLPVNYQPECQSLAQLLGPFITSEITDEGFSPDLVCYSLNICYRESKQCNLFPLPRHPNDITAFKRQSASPIPSDKLIKNFPWVCYLPGMSSNITLSHFRGNAPFYMSFISRCL